MDPSSWEKIQSLFHTALDLPDSERQKFLESACHDDPQSLLEVQAMLESDKASIPLLDNHMAASHLLNSPAASIPFADIGPYQLVRVLGEGGMGVVWLARRKDTDTYAAIKFLPHAALSPARRERFSREIKTLARMRQHPSIASFYDAGTLPDATPWFAMQYVEGSPLTGYCDQHQLSIAERLQLFHQVCEAVQFAHGQGIIHRDLKPSNILVDATGTPRLLDFGIARELDSLDDPSELTRPGLRMFSPDYAAPEWISDGTVGLYTDVYSLGVLLYQLLTGHLPFAQAGSEAQTRDLTRNSTRNPTQTVPTKPSQTARAPTQTAPQSQKEQVPNPVPTPHRLSSNAWSELDTICLKALHHDWQQRYQSAEALLRDLDHFNNNEPLEARPDSTSYRLRKFLTRNSRPVLASALTLALIVTLVIVFTIRLEKSRNAALAEAARSARIQQFMLDIFGGSDDEAPSQDLRAVDLLDRAEKQVATFDTDPQTQVELYQTLGRMYDMLSKTAKSYDLLNKALAIERARPKPDPYRILDLLVQRGVALSDQSQFQQAEKSLREALALAQQHLSPTEPEMFYVKSALGKELVLSGNYPQALTVLEPLVQFQPHGHDEVDNLRQTLNALGIAEYSLGHYQAAEAVDTRAVALTRSNYAENNPRIAESLINLGQIQTLQFEYPQAESNFRQAVAMLTKWFGADRPETAVAQIQLSKVFALEGHPDQAYPILLKAQQVEQQAYGELDQQNAVALDTLGRIEADRGNLPAAAADFQRSVAALTTLYGPSNFATAIASADLGDLYTRQGHPAQGEPLLHSALDLLLKKFSKDDPRIPRTQAMWAHSLVALKRYKEAEQPLNAAYQHLQSQPYPPQAQLRIVKQDLATIQAAIHSGIHPKAAFENQHTPKGPNPHSVGGFFQNPLPCTVGMRNPCTSSTTTSIPGD